MQLRKSHAMPLSSSTANEELRSADPPIQSSSVHLPLRKSRVALSPVVDGNKSQDQHLDHSNPPTADDSDVEYIEVIDASIQTEPDEEFPMLTLNTTESFFIR